MVTQELCYVYHDPSTRESQFSIFRVDLTAVRHTQGENSVTQAVSDPYLSYYPFYSRGIIGNYSRFEFVHLVYIYMYTYTRHLRYNMGVRVPRFCKY